MSEKNFSSKSYKIITAGATGELVEKKSRFIAVIEPIESEEEALELIEKIRKKHYDARHNCYAYTVGFEREITRSSDDGEPGGTAGRPMLELLLKENLYNVAAVVTRYFGGTLLGTGGLVRAYQGAVREGLAHCKIEEKRLGIEVFLTADYNSSGKVEYILRQKELKIIETQYTDKVRYRIAVPMEEKDQLLKELTEETNGKMEIEEKTQQPELL